jgi:hypothetical protein
MAYQLRAPWAGIADGPKHTTTQDGSASTVGVVTTVDYEKGELTLVLRGGVPMVLTAHPSLLKEVRLWTVVQVVTEGTVIRSLRCL